MTGETHAGAGGMLPILEYIYKTYLAAATDPVTGEKADLKAMQAELSSRAGKRQLIIDYLRTLSLFRKHILESAKELVAVNDALQKALAASDADAVTSGWFRAMKLLINLKLYRGLEFSIEKMDKELVFSPEETAFLDAMAGLDLPLAGAAAQGGEPIVTRKIGAVEKQQLWEKEAVINPDYEEPLRKRIREYVLKTCFIERLDAFSGTLKPLPPNQYVKTLKADEEIDDMTFFRAPSQFLRNKFARLRSSTYRPLGIERHESGGYTEKKIAFSLEGDRLVENPSGLISCTMHYMTPHTIWQKMVSDVSLMETTLKMGAKKIDKDYFFNIFYHIQKPVGLEKSEAAPASETFQRFDPSLTDDQFRHRDRLTAEQAANLVTEFAKVDQYVFGGHLDLDLYLDSIGIRKKPFVMMIEGEGLASYDYINNLIILPTICPPKISPLEQVVSALADFRYSLWIDSPKDIFDKQGVGFMIVGRRTSSAKQLWQIFPSSATAIIKQRAFREHYVRYILSNLFANGIKSIAGFPVPIVNRIADQKLRQYFEAYIPLSTAKGAKPEADGKIQAAKPAAETKQPVSEPPAPPPPPPAAPPAPKPPPLAQPAGAVCRECGKELPAGSAFCLSCGAKIAAKSACRECRAELPPGSKFCNVCGAKQ